MSPIEQFKILIEERPEQAAQILDRGQRAVQTLMTLHQFLISRTLQSAIESNYFEPRVLLSKDRLPIVAMKYGVLWDRFQRMCVDWNSMIEMVQGALDTLLCTDCGRPLSEHSRIVDGMGDIGD